MSNNEKIGFKIGFYILVIYVFVVIFNNLIFTFGESLITLLSLCVCMIEGEML